MAATAPLRMAIVQQPMAWTTRENVSHIVTALGLAARQGAELCIFPELALTGFHRGIRGEAVAEIVAAGLAQVLAACRSEAIAAAFGAPTFADAGSVHNSYVVVDAAGEIVGTVSKNGLTPAELTFFAAGSERAVHPIAGRRCTTVLCREIDDLEAIAAQLRETPVELVFWPSIVGSPPGTIHPTREDTEDPGYLHRTARLARRLSAFVVQSNWPHALNTPERTHQGESKVYAPDGEVLLTLPRDAAGFGVFELGDRHYHWTALPV